MKARKSVLAQAPFEFADSAPQRERAFDRHRPPQVSIEEVLESIHLRRAGDLDIDAFLD